MIIKHLKYAAVIDDDKNNYLTESQLNNYSLITNFNANYQRIKENCGNYSGVEASGVSEIYHKHSYLAKSNIVVLDIEVSFKSKNVDKHQERIDLLLYDIENQTLQFVEAKHYSNKELWSKTTPKAVKQIRGYEKVINANPTGIIKQYSNYISVINRIFGLELPVPTKVEPKVMLLIFDFDANQREGRLKELVIQNNYYKGIKLYCIGNIKKIVMKSLWNGKVL